MRKILTLFMIVVMLLGVNSYAVRSQTVEPTQLEEINQQWQSSAHALGDVNCSSCHIEAETKQFITQPRAESCRSCHEEQVETFLLGKHGIRTLEGLSPLTPKMADLPMKESAKNKQMNCNTCHNVHTVNTYVAAVDSCLSCHNDTHSLNYKNSKHAQLFAQEGNLPRPSSESVTCSTCHLPRQPHNSTVLVNHNNTYTLLPRDRMVKEVCINCHGVEYAYESIFDDALVENNFAAAPTQEMETFEMVRALEKQRSGSKKTQTKQPQQSPGKSLSEMTEVELLQIQEALYNAGFDVDVDGFYGPGTEAALQEFQQQNQINEGGKIGTKTRKVLGL